jgi:hypothetical protein
MQHPPSLDVTEFRRLVDDLCASARADLDAAHRRLDRLRREGTDGTADRDQP